MNYNYYNELFNKSDEILFQCIIDPNHYYLHDIRKKIIDKYPSTFFDKWINTYGICKEFTKQLILRMSSGDIKWIELFFLLVETGKYNTFHFNRLGKSLLKNNLIPIYNYYALFVNKNINVNNINNINVLESLLETTHNTSFINCIRTKLFSLYCENITNYNKISVFIASHNKNNITQIELLSKCNIDIYFKLIADKIICIDDDKSKQQLLTYSIVHNNINLVKYLITQNIIPDERDMQQLLGLTNVNKKKKKVEKIRKYTRYSYRIQFSLQFKKHYTFNNSIFKNNYEDVLVDIINMLYVNGNSSFLDFIKKPKLFLKILYHYDLIKLLISISKILKIKVTLKSYQIISILQRIIAYDDPKLLKDVLLINIISTEKFNNNMHYLKYAIRNGYINNARYMINDLKMKIGSNIFFSRYYYNYRDRSTKNNVDILKFMQDNNICINDKTLDGLILLNDFDAIKYCVEVLNVKIKLKQLINLFTGKYNKNKSATIFKYFYDKYYADSNTNTVVSIIRSLLTISNIITAKSICSIIKYISHDKKLKNAQLLKYSIIYENYNVLIYLNQVQNISLNKIIIDDLK